MVRSGRPRKGAVDDDIVTVMAELVAERGYASVTVDQVVARARTNKPAFYRRFRHLADVVPRILAARHGTPNDIDTGSLVGDLVELQRRQQLLFADPVVIGGLTGWLADIGTTPARGVPFVRDYLAPRRRLSHALVARAVARGEIEPSRDPEWLADLLIGPLIMRAVIPGLPPIDDRLIAQTIHAGLDALGYDGDRSAISCAVTTAASERSRKASE